MGTLRATTIVVLLGGLAAGGWLYAQGDGCTTLTGADIAEIEQLYASYNQGFDFKDVELYLSAYTDDGVFAGLERHAGEDALREYLARRCGRMLRERTGHTTTRASSSRRPPRAPRTGAISRRST